MGQESCYGGKENQTSQIRQAIKSALTYYDQGQIEHGIYKLIEASSSLDNRNDDSKSSGKTATNNYALRSDKVVFIHMAAKLWYRLKQYDTCLELLQDPRYNPSGYIPYKVIGDCCRRMGKGVEASGYYSRGLDQAKQDNDDVTWYAILCNWGLLLMDYKQYDQAAYLYSLLVCHDYNNLLYNFHLGQACILNGDFLHGLAILKKTFEAYKQSPDFSYLSSSNQKFISKEIDQVFNVREFRDNEQLPFSIRDERTFKRQVKRSIANTNLEDGTFQGIKRAFQASFRWYPLLNLEHKWKFIQESAALKEIALGMEQSFLKIVQAAKNITNNIEKINLGWIIQNLASLIPVVGGPISKVVRFANAQLLSLQLNRHSAFILSLPFCCQRSQLNPIDEQFGKLMNEVCTQIIYEHRQTFIYYKPSQTLTSWDKSSVLGEIYGQTIRRIQIMIYDSLTKPLLFKYGILLMQRIFDSAVINGQVYEGHPPANRPRESIVNYLVNAGFNALSEDKQFSQLSEKIRSRYP